MPAEQNDLPHPEPSLHRQEPGARADQEPETEASRTSPRDPSPSIPWRLGGFLLLTTMIVVFAVQNTQDVDLEFLGWTWTLPLVIVILIVAVLAVLLDEVLGGMVKRRRLRTQRERAELERLRKRE